MAMIPLRPLLEATSQYGFAQGAFNVNAISQIEACIDIHDTLKSAAILQGADFANGFMGGRSDFLNSNIDDKRIGAKRIADAVKKFSKDVNIPVVLHLDHGKDLDSVKAAIDGGYTSVMIDGSHLPYNQNLELTREVVKYAHGYGVSVEGELGILAGVEDNIFSESSTYTNPVTVVDFIKKTGVDCLAISYGTMHGPVKGENVKLRKEIAIAATENLRHENIFGVLVSHGSSTVPKYIIDDINKFGGLIKNANGIDIKEIQAVIPCGIGKINVDTDIRLAVTRNIREFFIKNSSKTNSLSIGNIFEVLKSKPDVIDPRVFLVSIMDTLTTGVIPDDDIMAIVDCIKKGVKEVVGTLIVEFGSVGKASLVEQKTLEEMADFYKKQSL